MDAFLQDGGNFNKVVNASNQVGCTTPSATELQTGCTPEQAGDRIASLGGGSALRLPQSCTAIGTVKTEVVIGNYSWSIYCIMWKHAFCVEATGTWPHEHDQNPCP